MKTLQTIHTILVVVSCIGAAQAALSIGDLAIIGLGSDTSYKSLSFVVLKPIQAGETVTFTDSGWLNSGSFRGSEGAATYTFPTLTLPGTVISASGTTGATWANNSGWNSADDSVVGTNGMNFSTSGDSILAYTGTNSSPSFLFAASSLAFAANATNSNNTALPSSLTEGTSAVAKFSGASEFDNIFYSGPTTFNSASSALAAIADSSNWTGDNANYTPVTSFTVVPEPSGAAILGSIGVLGLLRRRR